MAPTMPLKQSEGGGCDGGRRYRRRAATAAAAAARKNPFVCMTQVFEAEAPRTRGASG